MAVAPGLSRNQTATAGLARWWDADARDVVRMHVSATDGASIEDRHAIRGSNEVDERLTATLERWRGRLARVRAVVALRRRLLAALTLAAALSLAWRLSGQPPALVAIAAPAALLALDLFFERHRRLSLPAVARLLDHHLGLAEQASTAIDLQRGAISSGSPALDRRATSRGTSALTRAGERARPRAAAAAPEWLALAVLAGVIAALLALPRGAAGASGPRTRSPSTAATHLRANGGAKAAARHGTPATRRHQPAIPSTGQRGAAATVHAGTVHGVKRGSVGKAALTKLNVQGQVPKLSAAHNRLPSGGLRLPNPDLSNSTSGIDRAASSKHSGPAGGLHVASKGSGQTGAQAATKSSSSAKNSKAPSYYRSRRGGGPQSSNAAGRTPNSGRNSGAGAQAGSRDAGGSGHAAHGRRPGAPDRSGQGAQSTQRNSHSAGTAAGAQLRSHTPTPTLAPSSSGIVLNELYGTGGAGGTRSVSLAGVDGAPGGHGEVATVTGPASGTPAPNAFVLPSANVVPRASSSLIMRYFGRVLAP